MAYIVMAYTVLAYIVLAYIVMAVVMVYIVTAYVVRHLPQKRKLEQVAAFGLLFWVKSGLESTNFRK